MKEYKKSYQDWLNHPLLDEKTRAELAALKSEEEIEDRFYKDLEFGTAGLRGLLEAGRNRMNLYTVARAAEGYARFFEKQGRDYCEQGLAISYDTRHFSREFAELTARIFVMHGINVYLSDEIRAVPLLAFAVRHYHCAGGVMITASHNPKRYNGFKVYDITGAQLPPEAAAEVAAEMEEIQDLPALLSGVISLEEAQSSDCWHELSTELDDAFNERLHRYVLRQDAITRQKDIKIVYTPLYGAGRKPVCRILKELGFEHIILVPEQTEPNPDFPTTPYPNPEDPEAMALGFALAEAEQADLLFATDPDADRLGLAVRNRAGEFNILTGNQTGLLLMDYLLETRRDLALLPERSFCVQTIVSGKLPRRVAEHYGVDLYEVLTGFKYIAEQVKLRDEEGDQHFQFGYEEAIGFTTGTEVRDKDACITSLVVAEMAAVSAERGETLYDRLQTLYARYGYAAEKSLSFVRLGKSGAEQIQGCMAELRNRKNELFRKLGVKRVKDYQLRESLDLETGAREPIDLPESNVLLYEMGELDFFCVRPSGTEPKIKIYMGFYERDEDLAQRKLEAAAESIIAEVEALLGPAED